MKHLKGPKRSDPRGSSHSCQGRLRQGMNEMRRTKLPRFHNMKSTGLAFPIRRLKQGVAGRRATSQFSLARAVNSVYELEGREILRILAVTRKSKCNTNP